MKQIAVWYAGWGEDWPLGRLADDGRTTALTVRRSTLDDVYLRLTGEDLRAPAA